MKGARCVARPFPISVRSVPASYIAMDGAELISVRQAEETWVQLY